MFPSHDHMQRIFITGDTAQKKQEHNDYSVFCVWAVNKFGKLRLLEMIRGKWEAPELRKKAVDLWNRWRIELGGVSCDCMYVEDKSSGTGLIQDLVAIGIPINGVQRDKDKLTRAYASTPYIESGLVELPDNPSMNKDLLDECEAFSRDDSHTHDDICDNIFDAIEIGLSKRQVSILDVL